MRRLESEALEREAERDRERQQHEEFRREIKNREQKWEKVRFASKANITVSL